MMMFWHNIDQYQSDYFFDGSINQHLLPGPCAKWNLVSSPDPAMSQSMNLMEVFKKQQGVWTPRRQESGAGYPTPSNPEALIKGYDALRTPSPGGFVTHYCPNVMKNKDAFVTPGAFNSPLVVKGVLIDPASTPAGRPLTSSTASHMWTDVSLGGSGYKPGPDSQESESVIPVSLDFGDSPMRIGEPKVDTSHDLPDFNDVDDDTINTSKKRKADSSHSPASSDMKKFKPMTKANLEADDPEHSSSSKTKEFLRQGVLDFFQKTQLKQNLNNVLAVEGCIPKPSHSDGDSVQ